MIFSAISVGLHGNGAANPALWFPREGSLRRSAGSRCPEVGDLIGWRYGGWRVTDSHPVPEYDLSVEESEKLAELVAGAREKYRAETFELARPWNVVIRHEHGPRLFTEADGGVQLAGGDFEVHFRTRIYSRFYWHVLTEPWMTCSCHGHIWPCQEIDQVAMAAWHAQQVDKLMAGAAPGVCAHCLQPLTARQRTLTFPEPSRLVPGAPGPTFHAGRGDCWRAAEAYERNGRLVDNPDVTRLASCPGIRFIHEHHTLTGSARLDCTAGPACTGLHGPAGHRRELSCHYPIDLSGEPVRPTFNCGYQHDYGRGIIHACQGDPLDMRGDLTSAVAADLAWRINNK